jgi:hypothetical protein
MILSSPFGGTGSHQALVLPLQPQLHFRHLHLAMLNAHLLALVELPAPFLQEGNLFNILIALVFGFSTLNILALASKGFDTRPSRLKPGELLAITAMVLSVCFLGWEMLHIFHIFPIHFGD